MKRYNWHFIVDRKTHGMKYDLSDGCFAVFGAIEQANIACAQIPDSIVISNVMIKESEHIAALEQFEDKLNCQYGDGWYEGFLAAKEIAVKNHKFECLENYSESDILSLSEYAEEESSSRNRKRWSQSEPTKQGLYWNWSGNNEDAPIVLSVLKSGTNKKCFVSAGQYGINEAVFCDVYGGWWATCVNPKLPVL